jgi:7-cyano-7-deazaguanine synthase in queuosine biosynthesis
MPAGCPTLYKKEFCEKVIELGKQGYSIAEMGLELGVCKQTIYSYMKIHPEFMDAMRVAVSFAQAWYEKIGREALFAEKFNSALWNKQVSCRFRDDYSDTSTVYNKMLDDKSDNIPESQIDKIAKEIALKLKEDF